MWILTGYLIPLRLHGIIRDQFPPEKLPIRVGVFSSMYAAGSVVGLAVGLIVACDVYIAKTI